MCLCNSYGKGVGLCEISNETSKVNDEMSAVNIAV